MYFILIHFLLLGFLNLSFVVLSSNEAFAAQKSKKSSYSKYAKTQKAKKTTSWQAAKMPAKMTEKHRRALATRQVAEAKRKQAANNRKGRYERVRISEQGIKRSYASFDGKPGSGSAYYRSQNNGADFEEIDTINVEQYMEDTGSNADENEPAGPRGIYDSDSAFDE